VAFSAAVAAGSTPVSGAVVTLYAVGTTGSGSAATSLVSSSLSTDATGTVSIPATYNCPSSTALVYLLASGGTVGSASANPNLVLTTPVGACGSIASGSKFTLNEATTVAAGIALQQFYTPGTKPGANFGASATNTTGLTNAFATAATLADPGTGAIPGSTLPANAIAPVALIDSLANALNACAVNAAKCATLYSAVAVGGKQPTNTLDAIYNLTLAPAGNVAGVYQATRASAAYAPLLSAAPTDWTVFLSYSGGGLNNPSGIAVDSTGSVWVASYLAAASKFSPVGAPVFANGITGFGLNNSYGLAIDLNDNAWIPNEQAANGQNLGSVSVLTASGASAAGATGYTAGGLDFPISVAIDPNGTVWVADFGNSHVTLLNASGQPLSGAQGYTDASLKIPQVVAVDGNHFGWVGNFASGDVVKVAPDGSNFTSYACCNSTTGIAIDASNNVWVANYFSKSVSMISSAGMVVSNQGYTGGGSLDHPQGIAIDGNGNVWVTNYRAPNLAELAGATSSSPGNSLSPAGGLGADAKLQEAFALAIDASGNIWVSNLFSNTITKFVGLAGPVKTPLSGLPKQP
jgi:streptogramin lyase